MLFFIKRIFGKDFKYSAAGSDTNSILIMPSLINTVQLGFYCNSITTGAPKKFLKNFLQEKYQITDSKSLIKTIDRFLLTDSEFEEKYLQKRYLEAIFFGQTVLDLLKENHNDFSLVRKYIENTSYDKESRFDFSWLRHLDVFAKDIKLLEDKSLISPHQSISDAQPLAFYYGLSITLVRCGLDLEMIEKQFAQRIFEKIHTIIRCNYSSWENFTFSYLVGRAAFSTYTFEALSDIARTCLSSDNSPWNKIKYFEEDKS